VLRNLAVPGKWAPQVVQTEDSTDNQNIIKVFSPFYFVCFAFFTEPYQLSKLMKMTKEK
jgi:hypothetical protein